jgi:hypothetical protein
MMATLAAVVFTMVACSSSSTRAPAAAASSSTPPTTTPVTSSSAGLDQLASICQQSNTQLRAAAGQAFGDTQPAVDQWRPFMLQTVLPLIEQRLDAMTANPAGQNADIKAIIDAGRAAVASARSNPQQLDPATRAPFDHYDDLTTAAGVADCGVGG